MTDLNPTESFTYTIYIQASPEQIWRGLTEPTMTTQYWRHQQAGPKTFRSEWTTGSTWDLEHPEVGLVVSDPEQVILEADPYRRLRYTWHTFTPEWVSKVGMDEATAQRMAGWDPLHRDLRHRACSSGNHEVHGHSFGFHTWEPRLARGVGRLASCALQSQDSPRDRKCVVHVLEALFRSHENPTDSDSRVSDHFAGSKPDSSILPASRPTRYYRLDL